MERVGVVDGCRTPFVKMGGALADLSPLDLSVAVVRELADRADLRRGEVGSLIVGSAQSYPSIPYLARETAIALGWDRTDAYSAESACATSVRTVVSAVHQLALGEHDVAIAGGAESMSQVPIEVSRKVRDAVRADDRSGRVEEVLGLELADLLPTPPGIAEPYTGLSLGEHAEEAVRDWDISREAADALALASHRNAAAATDDGRLTEELVSIITPDGVVKEDGLIRRATSSEKLAALAPVFDEVYGTVTAGNASPLTDGASAVLLMSEGELDRRGLAPKVWIKSWALTSHAPSDGVLLGPAYALPAALDRAGLALADLGLVDLHEAFAGQVLANLEAMASDEFARQKLGRDRAIGRVDPELLNVCGGSIALGHPFGATGTRILTQLTNEMRRRGVRYGALAICAGGTRGAAMVLEAEEV